MSPSYAPPNAAASVVFFRRRRRSKATTKAASEETLRQFDDQIANLPDELPEHTPFDLSEQDMAEDRRYDNQRRGGRQNELQLSRDDVASLSRLIESLGKMRRAS